MWIDATASIVNVISISMLPGYIVKISNIITPLVKVRIGSCNACASRIVQ